MITKDKTMNTKDKTMNTSETIAVQVNGKFICRIPVPPTKTVWSHAMADRRVSQRIAEKSPVRSITIPGRVVNIVVG